MFNLGPGEVVVLGLLALVFLGPRELPGLAKVIGTWRTSFVPRWSRVDWVLAIAASVSVALAAAVLATPGR